MCLNLFSLEGHLARSKALLHLGFVIVFPDQVDVKFFVSFHG